MLMPVSEISCEPIFNVCPFSTDERLGVSQIQDGRLKQNLKVETAPNSPTANQLKLGVVVAEHGPLFIARGG